ncbi:hypothetical protein M758_7G042600 [Ceratodon purpureus]|nr:hypothetical protein M758_7G042600 [Ceratodon purpureus]
MGRPWWVMRNRWMMLVAGMWVMCCAGTSYLYGEYSSAIKDALRYDQETLDTVGFFKELGESVGLLSGLLYDVWPMWAVLLLGAVQTSGGYMMAYFAVSGILTAPPVWAMSLYLCIGANGQTFFITAVLVSLVKRFPLSRGMVIGVMKGLVGLSAAVLTQFVRGLYPQRAPADAAKVLLFLGWFPAVVVAFSYLFFRSQPTGSDGDGATGNSGVEVVEYEENETIYFSFFAGAMLTLAAFLLAIIMLQNTVRPFPEWLSRGVCLVTLLLLLLPLGVVYVSRINNRRNRRCLQGNDTISNRREPLLPAAPKYEPSPEANSSSYGTFGEGSNLARIDSFQRNFPARGEDHTLPQALRNVDFWLLVAIAMIGLGSGLTAMDNVGQVGASLGYSDASITSFVSMISIWNFLGRLGAGALSELGLHEKGLPRPLFIMFALTALAFGHTIMALALPGSLYLGSILIGVSYGAHWSLIPTATSELFGLKHFGTLLNAVTMASPIGSYILSVRVAGFFYDVEARKQHPLRPLLRRSLHLLSAMNGHIPAGEFTSFADENKTSLSCTGAVCFRLTFFIMAAICAVGCLLCALLLARTRKYYTEVVYESCQLRTHGAASRERRDDTEQPR